jgi:signal transduction histidine kinase
MERRGGFWREVPAALWSRHTGAAVAHLVAGTVLWCVPVGVVLVVVGAGSKQGLVAWAGAGKPVRVAVGLIVLPVAVLILLGLTARLTRWQRARFHAILRADLLPFPHGPTRRPRLRALVARRTWRQLAYHTGGGMLNAVAVATFGAFAATGAVLLVLSIGRSTPQVAERLAAAAAGIVALLVAPWLARGAAAVDLRLARELLQPPESEVLARRVESLAASRAGALDAADAERRRIERDLHDGTQQRLASLAINLGLTRSALREDAPAEIRRAITGAHEEAKQALAELRHFIRGLHPAVLDELGLDAALSGIAARSPVPVRLVVDLRERPPATVEAVAYFVVSEALANVARHSGATRADVLARRQAGGLRLEIADDGRGGADPSRGTGLRGLRQRVESVDGELDVTSPAGGPTSIRVTLPCGW